MKRTIILADKLGFCGGVKRAVQLVEEESALSKDLYTYGPLVHNPQVIARFESRGVKTLEEDDPAPEQGTVVIRAHGVSPDVYKKLESCGLTIKDGTCPKVKKSQEIIQKYASEHYQILIVGDPGHGEVLGLLGQSPDAMVISSEEEAGRIKLEKKVLLLSQTTIGLDKFESIAGCLKERNPAIVVKNRICPATEQRQEALKTLIPQVEALVILGGRNSANTARLYQIALNSGKPCWLVEEPEELDRESLKQFTRIGISAGASTPDYLIEKCRQLLEELPQM